MDKPKSPFDYKQRQIQKIYKENLKIKKHIEKEGKGDFLIFVCFVILGLIVFSIIEYFFL